MECPITGFSRGKYVLEHASETCEYICFFPPKSICIIKERIGWVFLVSPKSSFIFKDLTKTMVFTPKVANNRVFLMPCCLCSPWGYVPNWPKWSSVFLSKWLSVHCSSAFDSKRRRFLPGFSCQNRKRFLDLGVFAPVFFSIQKTTWLY